MVGTPLDVVPYIRGVQLVLLGYNGYTKGSRFENDKMVREEISRATGRVRSHMQNIFDSQFKAGNLEIARAAKQCMEECDFLIEDVRKAIAGMEHAFLSGQRSPSNRDLKKLIKHDHEVIDMVTKAVNIANSAEQSIATGEGNAQQMSLQSTQMITSCRGFFGARANVLAGLKHKKMKK
tara:strand:- start:1574 stop:2110 length:537 start_codon:yes stop_codon:yes gene_type:complete